MKSTFENTNDLISEFNGSYEDQQHTVNEMFAIVMRKASEEGFDHNDIERFTDTFEFMSKLFLAIHKDNGVRGRSLVEFSEN